MAIDFNAILRGQRAASNDMRAERRARQNDEIYEFQREQRRREAETQGWDQEAATYASTLLTNMQRAADAGQDDLDFLIAQRNAVLQDPGFNAMQPEVQERVLKRLGEAAQVTAQQRLNAGDPSAARRLYSAFGWGAQIPERDIAFSSGDPARIIQAIDPGGTLLRPNPDGTLTYLPTGQIMRADRLAAVVQQGGGAQALPLLAATLYQEDTAAKAAQAQQAQATQLQVMMYEAGLMQQGFIKQADGSFLNPTTGAKMPPLALPAGATPAGTSPAPAGAGAAAVSAPVPPPAQTGTPVEAPAWQAQLATIYNDAQSQAQTVTELEDQARRITARLNVLDPQRMRDRPDRARFGYLQPSPEVQELAASLASVRERLDEALIAEKTTRQHLIPQLESQLSADVTRYGTAAPWAPALIERAVVSGATMDAAQAAVQISPAVVNSQLELIRQRLAELEGAKGQEKEIARLSNARDNLMAALAVRRR